MASRVATQPVSMRPCIGIDLGEKTCVMAGAENGTARVLANRENQLVTPVVVSIRKRKGKEDEILVGGVALNNWPLAPRDTIIQIRRLMGRGIADKEVQRVQENFLYQVVESSDGTKDSVQVVIGGKQYSPEDVSAMILRKIKEDAEFRLGEQVTGAVITVPAYFSHAQKAATLLAGQEAGLRVLKLLDEPTAAAIAFGIHKTDCTDAKYLCVYALDDGHFDFSVLLWAGNVFASLGLDGDPRLGADNFDRALVNHALEHLHREYSIDPRQNLRFMAELRRKAAQAKEALATANTTEIIVPGLLQDEEGVLVDLEVEVTRAQFEELCRPLVHRSIELVQKVLKAADLMPEQIDYVLMVGNSSALPFVHRSVEKLFGPSKIQRGVPPEHAVALGAARCAEVFHYTNDESFSEHLSSQLESKTARVGRLTWCRKTSDSSRAEAVVQRLEQNLPKGLPDGFDLERDLEGERLIFPSDSEHITRRLLEAVPRISIDEHFVMDFFWRYQSLAGNPIIYLRKTPSPPLRSEQDLHTRRGDMITGEEVYDHLLCDATPEGLFQLVIFRLLANKFWLYWHSCYYDLQVVCTFQHVAQVCSDLEFRKTLLGTQRQISLSPTVSLFPTRAYVHVTTFSDWSGLNRESLSFKRNGGNFMLRRRRRKPLIPYDCGLRM